MDELLHEKLAKAERMRASLEKRVSKLLGHDWVGVELNIYNNYSHPNKTLKSAAIALGWTARHDGNNGWVSSPDDKNGDTTIFCEWEEAEDGES